MKLTHNKMVKIFKGMGYTEADIYPDLKITVLKRDSEWVTVTNSTWETGINYEPLDLFDSLAQAFSPNKL